MNGRSYASMMTLLLAAAACREDAGSPMEPDSRSMLTDPVTAPLAWRQVNAGMTHTCGVTTTNQAFCWGTNFFGEAGSPSGENDVGVLRVPTAVVGGLKFTQVRAGQFYSCGITVDQLAYCWGANNYGQLGNGAKTLLSTPAPVAVAGNHHFVTVRPGRWHTCALTPEGAAFCWGRNAFGELGDGTTINSRTPVAVQAGGLSFGAGLSAGGEHTCAISGAGKAYCWGRNSRGQLGVGTIGGTDGHSTTPVPVLGGLTVRQISAGLRHTCAVTTTNVAYCWGWNVTGQLGNGRFGSRSRPTPVLGGLRFAGVSAGATSSCAVTTTDRAYCWGSNGYDQLGIGTEDGTNQPAPVAVAGGLPLHNVSVGMGFSPAGTHACGVTAAHLAYCWGQDFHGELGDDGAAGDASPVPVPVAGPM